ncbi:MAG: hypothetical protein R3F37_07160 [Candidatus Competibacteraceae bacterium]
MPHGMCYLWYPDVLWLNAGSDLLIALSYFMIPATLLFFLRRAPKLPFENILWLFSAFILLCGATHLIAVWTIWEPVYRFQGIAKLITGLVSLLTAVLLIPIASRLGAQNAVPT